MNSRSKQLSILFLVTLLSLLLTGCPTIPTPKSPPPAGSWLVLLCKASDAPNEPHPISYYQALFSKANRNLVFDYFDIVSNHTVDVSGTEVYGWYTMSVKTADLLSSVRNKNTAITRSQTARDCKGPALGAIAASGTIIAPANYAGIITVINVGDLDVGAASDKSIVTSYHAESEVGFFAHEMMHILGLPDSWTTSRDTTADHVWKHGGDNMYGDCWDAMSFRSCQDFRYFPTNRGVQCQELQGTLSSRLGWLPPSRTQLIEAYPAHITTVTLASIGNHNTSHTQLANIEVPNQGYYTVEYRDRTGFDQNMPATDEGIVIHELRNDRIPYLVQRQNGQTIWHAGEVFTDQGNYLSISIDSITSGLATLTINTGFSPQTLQAGSICGDKYRGQIMPCPTSTQCLPRRVGTDPS